MEILLSATCLALIIICLLLMIIPKIWSPRNVCNIRRRYWNRLKALLLQGTLSLLITRYFQQKMNLINKRRKMNNFEDFPTKSGTLITQIRKATMVLSPNFPITSNRAKRSKTRSLMKRFGSKTFFNCRHNFNGTSKGYGQTLAKPCPAPSQMLLNEVRRLKS